MITHYVVEYDHDKGEWSIGDKATEWLISDVLKGLTWERDTLDWFMLDDMDMVALRADLSWRLDRKDYANG